MRSIDKGTQGKGEHVQRGIPRNIVILGLVSLFTDFGSQMVFPLIPLFLTGVIGAGASIVGIVEGVAETTASLLKVLSGYYSDRIKRRKPFILFGYSVSSIAKPFLAVAGSWLHVLSIRVVERIGKGLRNAPRDALVAESSSDSIRGRAYGFHRAMDGIGSIAGALSAYLLLPVLGYRKLFLLAAVPGILAVLIIFLLKEKGPSAGGGPRCRQPRPGLKSLPGNLRLFILVASIFALGHFGYAFLLLKTKNIGLTDNTAILFYAVFYIVYTLCVMPFGVISDRIGRKPVLLAGYSVFAMTSAGLVFVSESSSLLIFFVIYGLFYAMTDGVQRAYVVDLAPPGLKATALGAFHTAIGLVALPGGFIAGLIWDRVSPEGTFLYGLICSLASIILFIMVKEKNPPKISNRRSPGNEIN
ncbi:MAG: MFS transporter [Candidatus Krumholzibacteriota bacterium]|nr:MFS transporter [Candidatus Krumholzibacteriota bacterium]